jgi:NADPH:quinone reductase-like Zn-dependent oxidoreductase
MKAAVVARFGRNWSIEVRDVPKPVPSEHEVLVRARATTVSRTDWGELRHPLLQRFIIMRGAEPRTTLGMDFAGEVESAGSAVSGFKAGDRVFGMCPSRKNGAQAEYVCIPEDGAVALIPEGIAFDQAPVCEGAYYAHASVSRFCRPGVEALIYGASGAIGTAAAQLAKYYGADVTAVVAGRHIDMAKSLGPDRVIDYQTAEFRQLAKRYDFVFDTVGKMHPRDWRRLLKPEGHFAGTDLGPGGKDVPYLLWSAITRSDRVSVPLPAQGSAPQFVKFLAERVAARQFRAVVDRKYPLEKIADAYGYVLKGEKTGIVVIDV